MDARTTSLTAIVFSDSISVAGSSTLAVQVDPRRGDVCDRPCIRFVPENSLTSLSLSHSHSTATSKTQTMSIDTVLLLALLNRVHAAPPPSRVHYARQSTTTSVPSPSPSTTSSGLTVQVWVRPLCHTHDNISQSTHPTRA